MRKNKIGYLVEISYKGKYFDAFDEIKGKKTVKGVFKEYLKSKNIEIIKGIQQAGRTDAKVSARSNYLYFVSDDINLCSIEKDINIEGLKIKNIYKLATNIILPDIVKRRIYIYHYPKKFLNEKEEDILKRCLELSGEKDFSEYTDHKGLKLKNHIRDVNVTYKDEKLYFDGSSFLPKQVRIMSGYILKNKKVAMNPKFLILDKIIFKEEIFEKTD